VNDEITAQRLGALLREGSALPSPDTARDPELARLLDRVSELESPAIVRSRRWLWPALAAAALVVIGLGAVRHFARHDLSYEVRGTARIEDRSVSAEPGEAVEVRFSEGSRFALSPGARLRIEGSSPDGSRLSLLGGEVQASVVHRAQAHWSVAAGPFEILVVGTRFNARWDRSRQRLAVELQQGAVEVNGGGLSAPVALRAGQRLEAGTAVDDWRITSLSSKPEEPLPPTTTSAVPSALPALSAAAPEPPDRTPAPAPSTAPAAETSWAVAMSRSDFQGIVEQAQNMGFERCYASCSPANLRILADAARYTGKFDLAEGSLLALRGRSPEQAAAANFFLGRLAESRGRSAQALQMYERYLSTPQTDYREEAMAGRLRLLLGSHSTEAARQAADSYLKNFPNGVHAATARRVLESPPSP